MSQVTHPLVVISAAQRKLQNIDGSFGDSLPSAWCFGASTVTEMLSELFCPAVSVTVI